MIRLLDRQWPAFYEEFRSLRRTDKAGPRELRSYVINKGDANFAHDARAVFDRAFIRRRTRLRETFMDLPK